jgi:DNA-binding PucR family transcriptional regulator
MLALRRHLDADQDNRNLAFRAALDHPLDDGADLRLPAVLLGVDLPDPADRPGADLLRMLHLFGLDGRTLGHQPALALSNDRIYALLPATSAGTVSVAALIAHLRSRAERTLHVEIMVVSSREVRCAGQLREERRDVDTALGHLRRSGGAPGHYTTDQLRTELVHQRLVDAVRAEPHLRSGVGELVTAHDRDHASEFAATLLADLRHFGDVTAASADLHIHQNTLRQRLRRAQDLFDVDLASPEQRILLELELAAAVAD